MTIIGYCSGLTSGVFLAFEAGWRLIGIWAGFALAVCSTIVSDARLTSSSHCSLSDDIYLCYRLAKGG